MLRRISVSLIAIMVTLGLVSQVFPMGDRPIAKKKIPAQKAPEIAKVVGDVASVDSNKSILILSLRQDKKLALTIDQKTMIYKAGKNIKLADIKKGDFANVSYEVSRGKNIAKSIKIEEGSRISTTPKKKR